MERVEALYARRIKHRDELQAALSNISAAVQFRRDITEGMEDATPEDKRRAFEILSVKVAVTGKKASVTCLIPGEPGQIDFNTCTSAEYKLTSYLALESPLTDLTPYIERYRIRKFPRPKEK